MSSQTYPLQIEPVTLQLTGTVTVPSSGGGGDCPTQRGYDAVKDVGLDNTGNEDCAATLTAWINSTGQNTELHFPPGRYRFNSTMETNEKNVKLIGDGIASRRGDGAVIFFTDQWIDALLWWNCAQEASNLEGPTIENIQFQDLSPTHDQLGCAIRLTNMANSEIRVTFLNMVPKRYITGSVNVQQGLNTVSGVGTNWTDDMAPGWIVIAGYPYEVTQVNSPTMLTIAIEYIGPSKNGVAYGINWRGIGVWCDPGLDFTQYGTNWHLGGRIACALFCSAGTGGTGTSRIKVQGGYLNGAGIADSMCCYLGPFSDTNTWDVAMNSYAFGIVIADGHQHDLQHGDYENAGGPPPVSGMPVDYGSCKGVLVMSDNNSDTWGNRIGGYFRQVGTGIELTGTPGEGPDWTVIGACTFRSNKVNIVLGNATNTQGDIPTALFADHGGYGARRGIIYHLLRFVNRVTRWLLARAMRA